jgi:hypothetical protein
MARSQRAFLPTTDAIILEGGLIRPAVLARIATQRADQQSDGDYSIPKGLTLRDEIARYFRIGQALFAELHANPTPSTRSTVNFVEALFRDVLGFADIVGVGTRTVNGRVFAVTLETLSGRVPVVVVPPSDSLDRASDNLPSDGYRRSAASAIQDWLNAWDGAHWGFCCNGERLRLLRDNASLTRPAYIEADLRQMFDAESFSGFTVLWLLFHVSRFGIPNTPPTDCALERWREAGNREGVVARERLSDGVEAALKSLGTGFLAANPDLRQRIQTGELPLADFFGQLLRIIYRLIFLLAAEDRGLLHTPDAAPAARFLYAQGYSLAFLRDRAIRRTAWDAHHDKWEGLLVVFNALARGEKRLALPALGGLFTTEMTPDLISARLPNRALMEAIFRLAWLREEAGLVPVNWREMETEELGSVYESLLELTPRVIDDARGFAFAEGGETKGHARKTTGSYYTPDSLVQALLDSALDPVLDQVEAEGTDGATTLLGVTVLDPACGSGHFLLAAARRIATRLARARAGGIASPEDFRRALRDVVRSCIYAVDRNPMAVELTKVALWIETVEPGKPLGFLDANIRCGDSVLGVFDLEALEAGIPDAAYKPLTGDDKATAKYYAGRNRDERSGQGLFDFTRTGEHSATAPLVEQWSALRALSEDSTEQIAEKRRRFHAARMDQFSHALNEAAGLYVAAFLVAKVGEPPAVDEEPMVPTTGDVWRTLAGEEVHLKLVERARETARQARVFNWPLEFPDIMGAGGFDIVLGNPPWERIKLQEQEFFAALDPEIAEAPNAAARARLISALAKSEPGTRARALYKAFEGAKRLAEASSIFARESGRFLLTGRGDVNTYALFAELFTMLVGPRGRSGVILPTGIATDATTAPFFAHLIESRSLVSLHDFQTGRGFFDRIGHARFKFCLMTSSPPGATKHDPAFSFFSRTAAEFADRRRHFTMSAAEIARINPNTKTAPIFRTSFDADLTAKIHDRVPVLIEEAKGAAGNPWGVSFARLFDMANDSRQFRTATQLHDAGFARDASDWVQETERYVPLYEAKMVHQFDHRWATYDGVDARDTTDIEKRNPDFEPIPRYWVPEEEVAARLAAKGWNRSWLIGWRDITNATNERTLIPNVIPRCGCGDTFLLAFPKNSSAQASCLLLANWSSLITDYVTRQKIGGVHLKFNIFKQIAVLPPTSYAETDIAFIVSRVLELTYTSHSMVSFAHDLGYKGPPFVWDEDRRALLRAELDAWYARAYGHTRDELRYVLDPSDVMGPDYPSETFRILKNNEIRRFGEYRAARLVLDAWDRIERGLLT